MVNTGLPGEEAVPDPHGCSSRVRWGTSKTWGVSWHLKSREPPNQTATVAGLLVSSQSCHQAREITQTPKWEDANQPSDSELGNSGVGAELGEIKKSKQLRPRALSSPRQRETADAKCSFMDSKYRRLMRPSREHPDPIHKHQSDADSENLCPISHPLIPEVIWGSLSGQ